MDQEELRLLRENNAMLNYVRIVSSQQRAVAGIPL